MAQHGPPEPRQRPTNSPLVRRRVALPSDLDAKLTAYATKRGVTPNVLIRMILSANME